MITEKFIRAQRANTLNGKTKYVLDNKEMYVEQLAQKFYEKEGFISLWSENNYWWTIFSLLFWDVIYAKIDGVWTPELGEFPSRYQDMPQDFFSDRFYEKRKTLFDNKIKELSHSDIKQRLHNSYKDNFQKPCRPIENWNQFSIEELSVAVEKIENDKLLKILERLAKDFKNNRAGMPDLFVYSKSECFFAEVKGEKDNISNRQRLWHSFLSDELDFKVEIFMVNKNERQSNTKLKSNKVNISFGKSISKKREEAIAFMKKQPTFQQFKKKNEDIYSATFDVSDIENLYTILDFTSGWKSQKIEVDGIILKSTNLRDSLYCFRQKERGKKSMDYCLTNEWDGKKNKYQCRNFSFRELDDDFWDNYGYIDTQKEEWIFDKKAIQEEAERQIDKLSLCPLFNECQILSLIKKIPDTINPKTNNKWGFIDNNRNIWFWKNQQWHSRWNDNQFPGISMMIGVKKLKQDDIQYSSSYKISSRIDVDESVDEPANSSNETQVWYKTWWGIFLIIIFFIILTSLF